MIRVVGRGCESQSTAARHAKRQAFDHPEHGDDHQGEQAQEDVAVVDQAGDDLRPMVTIEDREHHQDDDHPDEQRVERDARHDDRHALKVIRPLAEFSESAARPPDELRAHRQPPFVTMLTMAPTTAASNAEPPAVRGSPQW